MKKNILAIVILITISIAANAQVTKGQYGFKSGHVEYELTGNTTGTRSLWWDDFGAKSRTETNSVTKIEMFGIKNETKMHTVNVINGEKYWFANLDDKTGQEGSLTALLGYTEIDEMTVSEKEELGNQIIDSLGGERIGTEMFLGCNCDIVSMLGSKSWNCKGVILKSEVETMGIVAHEIATSFDKNIIVPAIKFEKVLGITYTNNDEEMKMLQQYLNTEGYSGDDD